VLGKKKTEKMMSRREEMINMLIDDDINTFQSSDSWIISDILRSGFKGYENYTEEELVNEMNERELWTEWFKETV
jgi:hypothetical protein